MEISENMLKNVGDVLIDTTVGNAHVIVGTSLFLFKGVYRETVTKIHCIPINLIKEVRFTEGSTKKFIEIISSSEDIKLHVDNTDIYESLITALSKSLQK